MRWILGLALLCAAVPAQAQTSAIVEASIDDLQASMRVGEATSVSLTQAYIDRIAAMDRKGPGLRAVIAVNPQALAEARASDTRRKVRRLIGPLDGVPVLIKDNIETRDQPTTAGSLALAGNDTKRDAPLVARLRAQGAVILGKTNLSEWANIRSSNAMSGWSAVGGLVRNPYALDRTACGSSSGSGAAVAASFAAVAVGTETDGSVICPASMNGLVGLKPTVGRISRTWVVPISHSQDTPGPMGRSVKDVAILFSAMVGSDPADAATAGADGWRKDYAAGLSAGALKGMRIGFVRPAMRESLGARFDAALAQLRAGGAVLIEVQMPKLDGIGAAESLVLHTELKADLDAYLASTPAGVTARTLGDLIAFNSAHADAEMPFFAQETFEVSVKAKGLADPDYLAARAKSLKLAGEQGITAMLKAGDVQLLVMPSYGPAWLSDPVHGDQYDGPSASRLPAISGYPHLTVPMGLVQGLPVGLSFIGPAHSEGLLLGAGYAYEQRAHARVAPLYKPSVAADLGARTIR